MCVFSVNCVVDMNMYYTIDRQSGYTSTDYVAIYTNIQLMRVKREYS